MGDHRISYTLTFSMHGVEDKVDAWVNWSDELPEQIAAWFERNHDRAMVKWREATTTAEERRVEAVRKAELAELARLKLKYEGR